MPMGLGWTWDDADGISAFSVKQRPVFTNREDIWAAPVSDVTAVPTQVNEVTFVTKAVPPVVSSVAHTVVSKVDEATVSSFVSGVTSKPLCSIVNSGTGTSVATMSGQVKPITVQAEIHPLPRAEKPVVHARSKISKETRDLQSGAIADITAARIKHVSLSPEKDTGPCVRRHSVPLNPAPKLRSRSVERKTVASHKFISTVIRHTSQ